MSRQLEKRELTRAVRMALENLVIYWPEVLVFNTAGEVEGYAARRVIAQVTRNPNSVLTLPTGSTPIGMYEQLVRAYRESGLDLSGITVFNLDEYFPLPPEYPASYAAYMQEHLFQHVNVPLYQRHIPDGNARDAHAEAARYEALLNRHQVDLAIVGIGPGTTCHIGFNERGSAVSSRTRHMPLDEQTVQVNSQSFPIPSKIPNGTITQGIGNILEASEIMLLAKGENKAWGIKRTLKGPIGSDAPASFLRYHPHVTFVLDQAAAKLLTLS